MSTNLPKKIWLGDSGKPTPVDCYPQTFSLYIMQDFMSEEELREFHHRYLKAKLKRHARKHRMKAGELDKIIEEL